MSDENETILSMRNLGITATAEELTALKSDPTFKKMAMTMALLFTPVISRLEQQVSEARKEAAEARNEVTVLKKRLADEINRNNTAEEQQAQATFLVVGLQDEAKESLDELYEKVVENVPELEHSPFEMRRLGRYDEKKDSNRLVLIRMQPTYANIKTTRVLVQNNDEDRPVKIRRYQTPHRRRVIKMLWENHLNELKKQNPNLVVNYAAGGNAAITNMQQSFHYDPLLDTTVKDDKPLPFIPRRNRQGVNTNAR